MGIPPRPEIRVVGQMYRSSTLCSKTDGHRIWMRVSTFRDVLFVGHSGLLGNPNTSKVNGSIHAISSLFPYGSNT